MEHSPVVSLMWQIAAIEAADSHYEFIEPEHFFIGLCKLEGFANVTRLRGLGVPESQVSRVEAEIDLLMGIFGRYGIQTTSLRHELRQSMGTGNFRPAAGEDEILLHRSEESRQAFIRAEKVARKKNASSLAVFHLLAGLLHVPDSRLSKWLQSRNINVVGLRQSAETTNLGNNTAHLKTTPLPTPQTVPATEPLSPANTEQSMVSQYSFNISRHVQQFQRPPGQMTDEILQAVIGILNRPSRNNALVLTESDGLARQMVYHLAWNFLQNPEFSDWHAVQIIQPNLSALSAEISYQGEFADRLKKFLQEISNTPNTILFIDTIEVIIGSGTVHVEMDAVIETLVATLSSDSLWCIGATVPDEYSRYIRRNDILARLFTPHQLKASLPVVRIPEPAALDTGRMMNNAPTPPPRPDAPPSFIGDTGPQVSVATQSHSPLVTHLVRGLENHLQRFGITLEVSPAAENALTTLASSGQSTLLRETFVGQIENPLGGMILRGEVEYGQSVRVDVAGKDFVLNGQRDFK